MCILGDVYKLSKQMGDGKGWGWGEGGGERVGLIWVVVRAANNSGTLVYLAKTLCEV